MAFNYFFLSESGVPSVYRYQLLLVVGLSLVHNDTIELANNMFENGCLQHHEVHEFISKNPRPRDLRLLYITRDEENHCWPEEETAIL